MKKYIILALIILAICVAVYLLSSSSSPSDPRVDTIPTAQETKEVIVVKLIAEGFNFPVSIDSGSSVLDAMKKAQKENKFEFTSKEFEGVGLFIDSVNGKPSTQDMFWIYYINDKAANIGASDYVVKNGDKIEWKFEKNIY